jgi:3-hydroxyacyl-CoA dehydrogenase
VIDYELRDGVAVITIENPPVNALGPGVLEGIESAVSEAVDDSTVVAMVLVGAGDTFVAGADINVFTTLATREEALSKSASFHESLRSIESAAKPIVAAIHGHALGGGLELAMACHYRLAAGGARVGQPEVQLGLIPGAGGTQRLPRLAGVPRALEMCVEGQPIPAADAHAAGIVDRLLDLDPAAPEIRERLVAEAVVLARQLAETGKTRRTRELDAAMGDVKAAVAACAGWRAKLSQSKTPMQAPLAAIDAIQGACTLSFDDGSAIERELFADCLVSNQSRALVHMFFAEREATKVPGVTRDVVAGRIARAAVVGAGTMGGGIAMAYANAGIPVLLKDVDDAALELGLMTVRRNYESSVARGRMTSAALERAMSLITPATTYDLFDEVDIVVEAVFEDLALKKATFADLGRVTRPDCVLASNTSTLDIDAFALASGRGGHVVGLHFFSPANVMKLVEIVRGSETTPGTLATSQKLVKRLGKVGVVVGNCFGFVANRMLRQYLNEAYLMLEEGASVAQIDAVMIEFGMPVGPFGMEDIAGIDVGARIRQHLPSAEDGAYRPWRLANQLAAMGRFGQKTGAGWYRYEAGRQPIIDPLIDSLAEEAAALRGLARRLLPNDEILGRLTTAVANEGARVLDEGFATRAGDIDVIYCYGFGYPRYRGGPMFYADSVGLPTVLARVLEYRDRIGPHWQPAPLLEKLVAEKRSFYRA